MGKQKGSREELHYYKISPVFRLWLEREGIMPQPGTIAPVPEENKLDLEGLALLLVDSEKGIVDQLCQIMPIGKMVFEYDEFYLVTKGLIKQEVISAREQPLFAVYSVPKDAFESRNDSKNPIMDESALREKYNGKVVLLWAYNLRPIADVVPSGSHEDVMGQLRKKAGENPNYKPDLKGHMGNPTDTVLLVDFSGKKWEAKGCNTLEEPENDGLR